MISNKMSVLLLSCLVVAVASDVVPSYHQPSPYKEPSRPYAYSYSVNDDYHGTKFGAAESSDGANVEGNYEVLLPDGRTQVVGYRADHQKGFVADVSFKGVATYPAPAPYQPTPGYQK